MNKRSVLIGVGVIVLFVAALELASRVGTLNPAMGDQKGAGPTVKPIDLSANARFLDLTHPFDDKTIYWPTCLVRSIRHSVV